MHFAKVKAFCLFLMVLSSLLVSTSAFATDKREFQPKGVYSQNQDGDDAPTVENMLRAKQAGDFEKADRIQAILNEEAKKSWRSPGDDEIVVESPYPIPPQRDNAFYKSYLWYSWGPICNGPVSGGISVDYDTSGNVYAVRCTTWNGVANASIKVYKSIDGGESWSLFASFYSTSCSYSYPVVLTGSTNNKVYLFYLHSFQNGIIQVRRYTQSGQWEGTYGVKVDTDTITYFSACVDYENGNHLMVAYQKEEMGDPTPDLYTITSADYGETWSNEVLVSGAGAHPDIAYGRNGYVYLVFDKIGVGPDQEICFTRSNNYCVSGSWQYGQWLTWDSYDDTYPKVAALHTLPDSIPYVWVAYNDAPVGAYTPMNLGYAYSCNGGEFWSKNHILDSSTAYNEMACDLWTKRSPGYSYVNICYFKGGYVQPFPHGHIFYGRVSSTNPTYWGWLHEKSYYWPTQSEDGRKICQGTYAQGNCAIMWVGKEPLNDPFGDDFQNLLFSYWSTDVEEEMTEEEVPAEFSLSTNYPNPFNPVTRIQYSVGSRQKPIPTTLKIYNVLGQLVRTLVDEPQAAGTYEVVWNGRDDNGAEVASGVYLYRLQVGDFSQIRKMVLMK